MNDHDWNILLHRTGIEEEIKKALSLFEKDKHNMLMKRAIYLYGNSGSGKTSFVTNLLKKMEYDIVKYDAGDIRNKSIIETITKHNMSDKNVLSMVQSNVKKIVILIDEIDGMNSGDKGGINSLIKLVRPKKTKKQKQEEYSMNPVICIGNYHMDKKIKELMKVCISIELKTPTPLQMTALFKKNMPIELSDQAIEKNVMFLQGDLRKMKLMCDMYRNSPEMITKENLVYKYFNQKTFNEDTREITQNLINVPYKMKDHFLVMNDTDRTIVGLLWHENIIDAIQKMPKKESMKLYMEMLNNICYADYMDRITFQKQIWQFNELTSLMKTFHNNYLFHAHCKDPVPLKFDQIRFTKVLTKYSSEYNNSIFLQNMCQQLGMDKKDMIAFFLQLRMKYPDVENEIPPLFVNTDINKLDIRRMYRYLDHIHKRDLVIDVDEEVDEIIE